MLATKHSCDLVVIGGGATGVGVVRDAAMRGLSAILVERVDLAQGTTGRYHGLLHSGGRYVVSDPHSATECAEENAILKRIHPDAVECTGGLFVAVDGDDEDYPARFIAGATETGVPFEEIAVAEALRRSPASTRRSSAPSRSRTARSTAGAWCGARRSPPWPTARKS